ncbi:FG-GAP-like repeat-containing protein [Actinoplanes nipponensis]
MSMRARSMPDRPPPATTGRRSPLTRNAARLVALVLAMLGGVAVTPLASPAPAHAAAGVGQPITRSEVIERARRWIGNRAIGYSQDQSRAYPDGDGHNYRPDCSGFVSMALHLPKLASGWDYNTATLPQVGVLIGRNDLRPGDMLVLGEGSSSDHAILFVGWVDASHTKFTVFEQGSMSIRESGPNESYPHASVYDYTRVTNRGFKAYRYRNIVEDQPAAPPVSPGVLGDFDGDGRQDVAGLAGSDLWIHRNTSVSGQVSTHGEFVSSGWATVSRVMAADMDGDGRSDLVGFNGGDQLMVWLSTSTSSVMSFAAYQYLGSGWSIFDRLLPLADYDGDGKPDIAGVAGSDLWVHRNTSVPGRVSTHGEFVSTGWRTVSKFLGGDFDHDGKADVVGFNGGDQLMVWLSTSTSSVMSFGAYQYLGSGWSIFDRLLPLADYDGDGRVDVAGVAGPDLWVHRNTSVPGQVSTHGEFVSSGWATVSKFLGADFDHDGKADVVGFNGGDQLMVWRSTSGASTMSFAAYQYLGTGWSIFNKLVTSAPSN